MSVEAYEVDFELTYIGEAGGRVGTSLRQIFLADDDVQAVWQSVEWCEERTRVLGDVYAQAVFGAVKVHGFTVGEYDPIRKAFLTRRHFMPIFEWKCDFPGTLQEYVEAFAAKKSQDSPETSGARAMEGCER